VVVAEKQLAIVVAVPHAVPVAIVPGRLFPEAQAEQVPLPSGRHAAQPVTETTEEAVFLQRTQV